MLASPLRSPFSDLLSTTLNRPAAGLGPELVVNGSFATDTAWTKGTGWTIAAGVASAVATGASALSQVIAALVPGRTYRVTYSITAQTVAGDGIAFFVGTVPQSTPRTGVGTYTQDMVCGAGTSFQFNAAVSGTWEGSIDNVSVRQVI